MKGKLFILIFFMLFMIVSCSKEKEKSLRVAAIQMNSQLGELDANLAKAEKLIREAFEKNADLVVLPEFFTTPGYGFAYNPKVLEGVCPLDGKPMQLLKKLSKEYNGIVGGSFIALDGTDAYNSFVLAFPDGTHFVHNKDYPTGLESCYYTGGSDDGVFETAIGNIGVALCWEFVRTGTAKRLLDRVDIVLGGSCWPLPVNPEDWPEDDEPSLLKSTPSRFACLVGVPVVHTNHVGEVRYLNEEDPSKNHARSYGGETQIVDGSGKIIERFSYKDGEGILFADVILGKVEGPTEPIPDGFWIPELQEDTKKFWKDALTGPFRKYYEETALPYYIEKFSGKNP